MIDRIGLDTSNLTYETNTLKVWKSEPILTTKLLNKIAQLGNGWQGLSYKSMHEITAVDTEWFMVVLLFWYCTIDQEAKDKRTFVTPCI
jgi:aspartate ammonia-lyase